MSKRSRANIKRSQRERQAAWDLTPLNPVVPAAGPDEVDVVEEAKPSVRLDPTERPEPKVEPKAKPEPKPKAPRKPHKAKPEPKSEE